MLEIIKRLFKTKNKKAPKEKNSDYPSGTMSISWNGTTGDFCVSLDVEELTQDSADTLGLLLFHFNGGNLTEILIKAVSYWAEAEEDHKFATKVLSIWSQSEEVSNIHIEEEDTLAVDPSEVFNLKQGLKEE